MIDWQTILTSAIFSGVFVSIILFLFKKVIEKGIETKFKEVENRQRLNLEELTRREGKVFDDQYELSKTVLALIYRIRNGSREMIAEIEKSTDNILLMRTSLYEHQGYFDTLQKLLLDNRVILPDIWFKELHDLKHSLDKFNRKLKLIASNKPLERAELDKILDEIKKIYLKIDNHYTVIIGIVQAAIGVE